MFNKLTDPIRDLIQSTADFTKAIKRLNNNVNQLSATATQAQETITDIQKSVDRFQFKVNAHQKVLQEGVDQLNQDLNDLTNRLPH
ncbi:hypothetical protein [Furfurilactobacillus entadae]|uniref:hypothetical protein n=1 Tax=Furfurilactobacillus entadae TaxID=2922307 RepID=UPI0035EEF98D